jgi:hypothetical protein
MDGEYEVLRCQRNMRMDDLAACTFSLKIYLSSQKRPRS